MYSNPSKIISELVLPTHRLGTAALVLLGDATSGQQQTSLRAGDRFRSGAEIQPGVLQPGFTSTTSFSDPPSLQKKNKPLNFRRLPAVLIPRPPALLFSLFPSLYPPTGSSLLCL